jgi:hypothetical protein
MVGASPGVLRPKREVDPEGPLTSLGMAGRGGAEQRLVAGVSVCVCVAVSDGSGGSRTDGGTRAHGCCWTDGQRRAGGWSGLRAVIGRTVGGGGINLHSGRHADD